eukprot:CAMPEP_0178382038 /NCGR_PEP_ID=MMETSP0689_2-20121128/6291_1 /TAXON_ID=160604 /ORGANISM="Amphidinium massartii, Strain CS-259" /LENGTH=1023 /DNA_ID=CAMNT_0020002237 /DNA_START=99 /DNA_END=3166 /DNA_ORIENTATION=-
MATSVNTSGALRAKDVEKLVRGQSRLESTLEEVKHSVDQLHTLLSQTASRRGTSSLHHETTGQGAVYLDFDEMPNESNQVQAVSFPAVSATPGNNIATTTFPLPSAIPPTNRQASGPRIEAELSAAVTEDTNHQLLHATQTHAVTNGVPNTPHDRFHEIFVNMQRSDYVQVKALVGSAMFSAMRSTRSGPSGNGARRANSDFRVIARYLPFHPTSHGRIAFDCFSTLVLMYDSLTVPVIIAWDIDYTGPLFWLSFGMALFWTVDMFLNFCTGFSDRGKVIMDMWPIIKRYMKGGFLVDLGVLTLDYAELVTTAVVEGQKNAGLRALKFVRFVKITRLVRIVAKLRMGLQTQIDAIWYYRIHVHGLQSYARYMRLAGVLMKLLLLIAWLSHFGSCVWFFIGRSLTDERSTTWYSELPDGLGFEHYVRGLYWTLSTMFSGASYISPNNTWEAAFAGVCVIIGAIFVTAITSSLAAILIEAQETQQEMKRKDRALTAFMEQRSTPVLLALEVRKDFLARASEAQRITELDLPFLPMVEKSLLAALRESQYAANILSVPILRILCNWGDDDGNVLQELCTTVTSFSLLQAGEKAFQPAEVMESAILVAEGHASYSLATIGGGGHDEIGRLASDGSMASTLDLVMAGNPAPVRPGSWVCELALLMPWKTKGCLSADGTVELLLVTVEAFIKLVSTSPGMLSIASSYAAAVCHALQPKPDDVLGHSELSDIETGVDPDVVFADLHWTVRQLMSMPLLADMYRHSHGPLAYLRRRALADLEAEVLSGKSYLLRGPSLSINRVVRLAVLRLMNSNGLVCVRVGSWLAGQCSADHQLPAVKLEGEESPGEGIERLLQTDFLGLRDFLRFEDTETVVQESLSEKYDILTKYIKVVRTVVFEASMSFNGCRPAPSETSSTMRPVKTPRFVLQTMSTKTVSNVAEAITLQNTPLSVEGEAHAFAIGDPSNNTVGVSLYKWMSKPDFESLGASRRMQANADITPWLSKLNAPQLRTLTSWSVQSSSHSNRNLADIA